VDTIDGSANTNGYIVARGSVTAPSSWASYADDPPATWGAFQDAAPATIYDVTSAMIPEDILVGHEITVDHPHFGTITGSVQSVSTSFLDGVEDVTPTAWPNFLDAGTGLLLDGSWTLDGAASVYRDLVLSMLPVAYWRLGEASGTVAVDQMGAYHGTYVATPTLGAAGALTGDTDTAVSFNGTTQYMQNTAMPAGPTVGFSLSIWVKSAAIGAIRCLFDWNGQNLAGFHASYLNPDGTVRYQFSDGAVRNASLGSPVLTAGVWSHVSITHDFAGKVVQLYVNGVDVGGADVSPYGAPVPVPATRTAQIGTLAGLYFFNGSTDEAAIWDRALSAAEIAALHAAGTAPGLPVIPRRMRVSNLTIAGTRRSFVGAYRAGVR
jgi:hypothetical protein